MGVACLCYIVNTGMHMFFLINDVHVCHVLMKCLWHATFFPTHWTWIFLRMRLFNFTILPGTPLQFRLISANPQVSSDEIDKLNDGNTSSCATLRRTDMANTLIFEADINPTPIITLNVTSRNVDFGTSRVCTPARAVFHQLTATTNGKHVNHAILCTEQPGTDASHFVLVCDCSPTDCNTLTMYIDYDSFMDDIGYLCAVDVLGWWERDNAPKAALRPHLPCHTRINDMIITTPNSWLMQRLF